MCNRVLCFAIFMVSFGVLPVPSRAGPDDVLIIAFCDENHAAGLSVQKQEYSAAELALKACLLKGGSLGCCKVEVKNYKARCAALAANGLDHAETVGDTLEQAREKAKRECGSKCKIVASDCRY